MKAVRILTTLFFAFTVSGYEVTGYHGHECTSDNPPYTVAGKTTTGCIAFDIESGSEIHGVKAEFDDYIYGMSIWTTDNCEGDGGNIDSGDCSTISGDVAIRSYWVDKNA